MTTPQGSGDAAVGIGAVILPPAVGEDSAATRPARRVRWRRAVGLALAVLLALQVVGSSAQPWRGHFRQQMVQATTGWGFDLLRWEVDALLEKASQWWEAPAATLDEQSAALAVEQYLDQGRELRAFEDEAVRLLNDGGPESQAARREALKQAATLRAMQQESRPIAEAALQSQVAQTLEEAGFEFAGRPMPPVLFTFTESPRKLVVSPRSRIRTLDSSILSPGMPLDAIEEAEAQIEKDADVSAYIAETGGMGAFPTMVVDDASLPWILGTVAHEWMHTYLSFFPLGFNYGVSPDNTTINETVADIAGDEIGAIALAHFYPHMAAPPAAESRPPESGGAFPADEAPFDYRNEMRQTRRTVDQLLSVGRVEDAERYMELRRLLFAENGYHLRKLNQAWFAFHGSYGTGPAADVSPDAIAPKVQRLRALTPDLRTFVHAVRGVVDAEGLDRVLAEWEGQ